MYLLVTIIKETYHPNAYLQRVKSVRSGLKARTKILNILDKQTVNAKTIAQTTQMSYNAVRYHLRLLEAEGTVCRKGKRPCVWLLTGLGQKRLTS